MNALFPLDAFPDWPRDVLGTFGRLTRSPVVANGGYDAAKAEAELAAGRADFISFGNLYIANPDLPARFAAGAALATANRATMYGGGPKGYIDDPDMADWSRRSGASSHRMPSPTSSGGADVVRGGWLDRVDSERHTWATLRT